MLKFTERVIQYPIVHDICLFLWQGFSRLTAGVSENIANDLLYVQEQAAHLISPILSSGPVVTLDGLVCNLFLDRLETFAPLITKPSHELIEYVSDGALTAAEKGVQYLRSVNGVPATMSEHQLSVGERISHIRSDLLQHANSSHRFSSLLPALIAMESYLVGFFWFTITKLTDPHFLCRLDNHRTLAILHFNKAYTKMCKWALELSEQVQQRETEMISQPPSLYRTVVDFVCILIMLLKYALHELLHSIAAATFSVFLQGLTTSPARLIYANDFQTRQKETASSAGETGGCKPFEIQDTVVKNIEDKAVERAVTNLVESYEPMKFYLAESTGGQAILLGKLPKETIFPMPGYFSKVKSKEVVVGENENSSVPILELKNSITADSFASIDCSLGSHKSTEQCFRHLVFSSDTETDDTISPKSADFGTPDQSNRSSEDEDVCFD